MPAQPSTGYTPEQEVRFAVVLYGGVSLAIYINGVAQELLHMVRATADLPEGETLTDSELVYRELGQILPLQRNPATSKARAPTVDPNDLKQHPIRTRFVVDIISGSSAGAINGVGLAKALALRLPTIDRLAEVWKESADLENLLNDRKSQSRMYPLNPSGYTASLINSERMYGMILETLKEMNDDAPEDTGGHTAFADNVDLFVTTTDLAGLKAPIQLAGQRIDERIHKSVFHFEYVAPNHSAGLKARQNDFSDKYDPMLAFAARCTSSFPVAFEPMCFDHIEKQIRRRPHPRRMDEVIKTSNKFFVSYTASGEDFRDRYFADGGYLDNRPFSYASEMIQFRSSTRPVKRNLLFVDPFPERPTAGTDPRRDISFIENATLAAMTLPRYEVIRGDIQTINAMNRQLYRLEALQQRIRDDDEALEEIRQEKTERPDSPADFENLYLDAMVALKGYGDKYLPYHHLRVYDVSDTLARILSCAAGFRVDSDYYYYIRLLVRAWREAKFSAYKKPSGQRPENSFLNWFDTDYRARRLNRLRAEIDKQLTRGLADPLKADIESVRQATERQLCRLQEIVHLLQSPVDSPVLKYPEIATLTTALEEGYASVMDEVDRRMRYESANKVYLKCQKQIDAVMGIIDLALKKIFQENHDELDAALSALGTSDPHQAVKSAYEKFHWHDSLTLPVLQGTGAREFSDVAIFRVSPADSCLVPDSVDFAGHKLAGIRAAAFGGFMDRAWRDNDMMWGRLDGAERIITALLPEPRDEPLRAHYIRRVHNAILREEMALSGKLRNYALTDFADRMRSKSGALPKDGGRQQTPQHSLATAMARDDLSAAFVRQYKLPEAPPNQRFIEWSARSLRIFSRMIDDLPGSEPGRASTYISSTMKSIGVILTSLLRLVLPRSLPHDILLHSLKLLLIAGGLFVIGSFIPEIAGDDEADSLASGIRNIGFVVIAFCVIAWLLLSIVTRIVTGRIKFRDLVVAAFVVIVLPLAAIGGYTTWKFGQGYLPAF